MSAQAALSLLDVISSPSADTEEGRRRESAREQAALVRGLLAEIDCRAPSDPGVCALREQIEEEVERLVRLLGEAGASASIAS